MSHYAKIVAPLPALHRDTCSRITVQPGIEIKNVTVIDGGFQFDAFLFRNWRVMFTDEDLPAFADKGIEHRAKHHEATLRTGRPRTDSGLRPLALRVSERQRSYLQRRARQAGETVSNYIRNILRQVGMP